MSGPRIGVDVGGTFTDVALERPDGTFASIKVLTTHRRPEEAVLAGISAVIESEGTTLDEITQIIHGTTLATNALIERRGAKTALVTTAGFRDVIETRTESRFEQYDLNIVLPPPLIERKDRYVVPERIGASGDVLLAFDEQAAREVVDRVVAGAYASVAVGFMHSYRNPDHERRFRDLLLEASDGIAVSLSCEISPQMREFERFNTVCANAYVQPLIASYLRRLESELRRMGAACPLLLIHSGGGLMSSEAAAAFPVRLVESGPAGGAIFAAHLARVHRRDRIVSYDMGGTTAKIALIEDCSPRTAKTFETARTARFKKGSGMPISVPTIEMIEIGAGGGSIATVDALGQIRVGPHSAGADPGPAAYDLGGTAATVTDANVQMGRLHPDTFGASGISLSVQRAAEALKSAVSDPLGLDADAAAVGAAGTAQTTGPTTGTPPHPDTDAAAVGVAEVVDENMANATRTHAVESGKDLTGYSVVAFGGAAPLHAGRLIDKLGIDEVLVPPGAGVGSAIGFLLAPFSYEATRSFYATSDDFDTAGVRMVLDELTAEAEAFVRMGTSEAVTVEREVLMRYRGQGWEIPVTLPHGDFDEIAGQELTTTFVKAYEAFFGRAIEGLAIEAVSWSVRVSSARAAPLAAEPVGAGKPLKAAATRLVHDPASGGKVITAVFDRSTLTVGDTVAGPALITEDQTTTVIASGHEAVVQNDLTLRIAGMGRPESPETAMVARRRTHNSETAGRDIPIRPASQATEPTGGADTTGRKAAIRPASQATDGAGTASSEVPMQIMWNRLISVVEEQALTLVRTAFSTSVREAGDLSAGVFDRSGRMIAQAITGTPGHVNTMAASLGHFIDEIGPRACAPATCTSPTTPGRAPATSTTSPWPRLCSSTTTQPGPAARAATNPGTSSASSPPPLTWWTSAGGASALTPASCTRRASAYPSCDGPSGAGSTGTWSTSCAATSGSPTR